MNSFWHIFLHLTYSWKDLPHYKRLSMPFIYMIYMCISLSPTKDPSNWTITNLRLIKGFFRVPPLCQSYESYELVQWAFYLLLGIAAKHRISNPYQWGYFIVFVVCCPKSLLLLHLQTTFHICLQQMQKWHLSWFSFI